MLTKIKDHIKACYKICKKIIFGKISIKQVILSHYNFIFHKDKSIILKRYDGVHDSNFGDALNVPIFRVLSDMRIIENSCIPYKEKYDLIMIGSIMRYAKNGCVVWGTGSMDADDIPSGKPKSIHAVRGPLTRKILLKAGYDCPEVYGDPALILSKLYSPIKKKKYKLGVIPHYIDANHELIQSFKNDESVLVINIKTGENWKSFVDNILQCETIISSTLHGVIVADTYNIPNSWVKFSENVSGKGFKFRDYYLSVGKNITEPVNLTSEFNKIEIQTRIDNWKPNTIDLDKLINSFPFKKAQ